MEISKQCVRLSLAQKMKVLGFKQVSLFYWSGDGKLIFCEQEPVKSLKLPFISAYTVAELGAMIREIKFSNLKMKYTTEWDLLINGLKIWENSLNEANNRADILIYLKENNLIKI